MRLDGHDFKQKQFNNKQSPHFWLKRLKNNSKIAIQFSNKLLKTGQNLLYGAKQFGKLG